MKAKPGDWLVVESRTDHRHARRAEIMVVHGKDGGAPYTVRWSDQDGESMVFPGPDAQVLSSAQLQARDAARAQEISQVQAEIRDRQHQHG